MIAVLLFLLSAATIYFACKFFVNGIEWTGHKCGVGETATGSVLAAFGTALPESAVTFMAVVFGVSAQQKDIGVGAALGGPLVLATLSYAMVGLVLWLCARKLHRADHVIQTDQRSLGKDQLWFLGVFAFKIALGLVAFTGKSWLGLLFFAAYGVYAWRQITGVLDVADPKTLEALKLRTRDANPHVGWVLLQTLGALGMIAVASYVFVGQVEAIGHMLGMSAQLVALLLSPMATELPETMNAIIWVRQGKERLALANISGAMMIQATVPSGLGILFTPWLLSAPLLIAGAVTSIAIVMLYLIFSHGRMSAPWLMLVGGWYAVFAAALALA